jgi:hypothetical protein
LHDQWWRSLKAGRSFVTNGPLLRVTADDRLPGHVFKASGGPIKLRLAARLASNDPILTLDVIRNGEIVRSRRPPPPAAGQTETKIDLGHLEFDGSGWFLVRAIADNPATFRFASSAPFYVEAGAAPRRISRRSASFFHAWVDERIARVHRNLSEPSQQAAVLRYHLEARDFWERRVAEANSP